MYNTKFTDKVYLIHKDGQRWEFKDIYDAVKKLIDWKLFDKWGHGSLIIDSHFRTIGHYDFNNEKYIIDGYIQYILRSEFGDIITIEDLTKALTDIRSERRNKKLEKEIEQGQKNFRQAPEPHIRCRRGGGYSYYRRIRTFSEHRDNEALLADEDAKKYYIKPRAKRAGYNLANSWDDIGRSDWQDKNWKRHRKTQWKKK